MGDLVYSSGEHGVVVVPIVEINRAAVEKHHVLRVSLSNGYVLEVSARHPTIDNMIGHSEYRNFENTFVFSELDHGYRSDRVAEPGTEFLKHLRSNLNDPHRCE